MQEEKKEFEFIDNEFFIFDDKKRERILRILEKLTEKSNSASEIVKKLFNNEVKLKVLLTIEPNTSKDEVNGH